MVKFRQRKYTPLRSTLNPLRETIIVIISFALWIYCLTSVIVIGGSLLHINANIVLLTRTVLNMDGSGMNAIFRLMLIFAIIIFILFTLCITIRSFIKLRGQNK